MTGEPGGRIFFSNIGRSLEAEDEVVLVSVGIDIGSSTSHLVFSRLTLERLDNRFIVASREVLFQSDILLTPYTADVQIDSERLGRFFDAQYALAGIERTAIDTGALILTGVAVRRSNARAIADLFAQEAGRFVAVSAGDALEATLAAFGSGAVALSSRAASLVMNIDIGGGTTKIALCRDGKVVAVTAADVGARIICFDEHRRVTRVEASGALFATEIGFSLAHGSVLDDATVHALTSRMAERLFEAMGGAALTETSQKLLRLDRLPETSRPDIVVFSGGVSEYLTGRETSGFGDLGPALAQAVQARMAGWGPRVEPAVEGIRATVVGASQYTVQVSGSTIFVNPLTALPLKNVPVIAPALPLGFELLDEAAITAAIRNTLSSFELAEGEACVALFYRWEGSATFRRLDTFCRGLLAGMKPLLDKGLPLVLVSDNDIGGLIGIHCVEEAGLKSSIVSIDGVTLSAFDYIDIGAMLEVSGAVPVVVKSLIFPTGSAPGRQDLKAL